MAGMAKGLKNRLCQEEAIAVFGHDPRVYQTTVTEFIKDKNGNVCQARIVKLKSEKDAKTGRMMMVPVEGTDKKEWVFWSADGYYQIGSFDAIPSRRRRSGRCLFQQTAYAAQNFVNVGERVLLVPWVRLDNANGWYRGAMGIPQESA